ncbi:MAG: protein kinase, partial [Candidatus Omnitrophica bacterium]|nr:protein kinase [Candidatus Omnitrophota bacterium]
MLDKTISNRYKLSEELISDPLGTLYKAQDLSENKPVFVSLLSEKSLGRPLEVLLRFKRAAEQASRLNHPDLLKIVEVAESDGKIHLVYESFDSQVLSKFINQPWDIDNAVSVILQISSALAVAHEQNIQHQAIQPANILLSRSQPQTAKLFNFGFSILKDISKITER